MNLETIDFMARNGGSFAKAIASAWLVADPMNRLLLETTFHKMFGVYDAAVEAEKLKARAAA